MNYRMPSTGKVHFRNTFQKATYREQLLKDLPCRNTLQNAILGPAGSTNLVPIWYHAGPSQPAKGCGKLYSAPAQERHGPARHGTGSIPIWYQSGSNLVPIPYQSGTAESFIPHRHKNGTARHSPARHGTGSTNLVPIW